MRQINIKDLNKHLSRELSNIPFEVVRYGKIIGVMVSPEILKGTDLLPKGTDLDKSGSDHIEKARHQLTEIVKKKKKVLTTKSTNTTDNIQSKGWVNPLLNTIRAPKA